MWYLILVSIIWAFSFGLIKRYLTGLDPTFVAAARLLLSLAVFAPFTRPRRLPRRETAELAVVGAVQYGLMYMTYIYSFQFLPAHLVALFTIFTPLYVALVHTLQVRQMRLLFLGTSLLAIAGTAIIVYRDIERWDLWRGFALLQVSNLCFAYGQLAYRRIMKRLPGRTNTEVFGWLYAGAVAVTVPVALVRTPFSEIALGGPQIASLLYLGIVASGLCFFWWNIGARKANAGALAVCNNLKIPLAVAVALLLFGEQTDLPRLLTGGAVILAALIANELVMRREKDSGTAPAEASTS